MHMPRSRARPKRAKSRPKVRQRSKGKKTVLPSENSGAITNSSHLSKYDVSKSQYENYKDLGLLADANQIGAVRGSIRGFKPRLKGPTAEPTGERALAPVPPRASASDPPRPAAARRGAPPTGGRGGPFGPDLPAGKPARATPHAASRPAGRPLDVACRRRRRRCRRARGRCCRTWSRATATTTPRWSAT